MSISVRYVFLNANRKEIAVGYSRTRYMHLPSTDEGLIREAVYAMARAVELVHEGRLTKDIVTDIAFVQIETRAPISTEDIFNYADQKRDAFLRQINTIKEMRPEILADRPTITVTGGAPYRVSEP